MIFNVKDVLKLFYLIRLFRKLYSQRIKHHVDHKRSREEKNNDRRRRGGAKQRRAQGEQMIVYAMNKTR